MTTLCRKNHRVIDNYREVTAFDTTVRVDVSKEVNFK